jgi:outer membrane protein assembly factor BamD (BamD/ComL family)
MKKYTLIILITLFFNALFFNPVFAGEDKDLYSKGIECSRAKSVDFAFSYFDLIVRNYPDSKFFPDALFAVGEYYFLVNDTGPAAAAFNELISKYPGSGAVVFAFFYLAQIAERQKNDNLAKDLETQIVKAKTNFLIFKDFKEYRYKSALSKKYKARYFIDRVEIFIDDKLGAKITF